MTICREEVNLAYAIGVPEGEGGIIFILEIFGSSSYRALPWYHMATGQTSGRRWVVRGRVYCGSHWEAVEYFKKDLVRECFAFGVLLDHLAYAAPVGYKSVTVQPSFRRVAPSLDVRPGLEKYATDKRTDCGDDAPCQGPWGPVIPFHALANVTLCTRSAEMLCHNIISALAHARPLPFAALLRPHLHSPLRRSAASPIPYTVNVIPVQVGPVQRAPDGSSLETLSDVRSSRMTYARTRMKFHLK
ncbi:hypothetical protein BJY52DRAFT_1228691 [Lactarius psammicola]|nr:hypothetical protein BJY52DRAFT_1228691 [Lactarius psammicola]